jgi:predicted nucleotidyltransferase
MHQILKNNIDEIRKLCAQHSVKSLFAFGSACTDRFDDDSDIDLLVSFLPMDFGDYADNYFSVAEKLEQVFQRPVDLVTDKSLSNPYFVAEVNRTKMLIYGRQD